MEENRRSSFGSSRAGASEGACRFFEVITEGASIAAGVPCRGTGPVYVPYGEGNMIPMRTLSAFVDRGINGFYALCD